MDKRILLLADIDSSHTRKWAVSLAERGYTVGIFSLRKSETGWIFQYPTISSFDKDGFATLKFKGSSSSKLGYLKQIPALKKVIDAFQPDIVHAHYATSYGLLGVRSRFHPLIISVWGSDVFDFPKEGMLYRRLLIYNLKRADRIFSTSHVMKEEVLKYVDARVDVTPFGVDVETFSPGPSAVPVADGVKTIGIIKTLEPKYGVDVLIRAFALVRKEYEGQVRLVICGDGTHKEEYMQLAKRYGVADNTEFTGRIPQEEVADRHRSFDVFSSLSTLDSESFGVSLVEAMACGKPAVVTAVGGLKEVAVGGETALLVPPNDERKAADALLRLLNDAAMAEKLGGNARQRVLEHYDWKKNLDAIEELYAEVLRK